jgi:hypothetical protein
MGPVAEQPWLGTIHALCLELLRPFARAMGLPPGFGVADESQQIAILNRLHVWKTRHSQLLRLAVGTSALPGLVSHEWAVTGLNRGSVIPRAARKIDLLVRDVHLEIGHLEPPDHCQRTYGCQVTPLGALQPAPKELHMLRRPARARVACVREVNLEPADQDSLHEQPLEGAGCGTQQLPAVFVQLAVERFMRDLILARHRRNQPVLGLRRQIANLVPELGMSLEVPADSGKGVSVAFVGALHERAQLAPAYFPPAPLSALKRTHAAASIPHDDASDSRRR